MPQSFPILAGFQQNKPMEKNDYKDHTEVGEHLNQHLHNQSRKSKLHL